MTRYDFDASIKQAFLVLHLFFTGGAAAYLYLSEELLAIFFLVSALMALAYYEMFQNKAILRRLEAHLNLIEDVMQESEEFKKGVKKKKDKETDDEEGNEETEE